MRIISGKQIIIPRQRWLSAILLIVGLLSIPAITSAKTTLEQNVVTKTNQARQNEDLPRLIVDSRLRQAAYKHGRDMITRQYFQHTSPSGQPFWHWLGNDLKHFNRVGENIARARNAQSTKIVNGWLASAGHRKNILNANFNRVGVAVVRGSYSNRPTTIIVQMFGTIKK